MTNDELRNHLHIVSGVGEGTVTEEQEKSIDAIMSGFATNPDLDAARSELSHAQDELKKSQDAYAALQKRYNDRFWSGEDTQPASPAPTSSPKKAEKPITIDDFFN